MVIMSKLKFVPAVEARARELAAELTSSLSNRVRDLEVDLSSARAKLAEAENLTVDLKSKLERQTMLVNRLEGLCDLRGVKPEEAINPGHPHEAKESLASWDKKLAAARTPQEKDAVVKAYAKAVVEGRVG